MRLSLFTVQQLISAVVKITYSLKNFLKSNVHIFLDVPGAVEMGAALLEFQGHINRFQVQ